MNRVVLNCREDIPEDEQAVFCTWEEDGKEYGKWFAASELVKVSERN